MPRPTPFDEKQARLLERFLSDPAREEGTPSFPYVAGFLFELACFPEPVMPSEWLPALFDDKMPEFGSDQEAQQVLGALMGLYNRVNDGVFAGAPVLPPGIPIASDPMENFADGAPLRDWANGFIGAHCWLEDEWDRFFPEKDGEESPPSQEFAGDMAVLGFFAHPEAARQLLAVSLVGKNADNPLDEAEFQKQAGRMLGLFSEAMASYAAIGRGLATILAGIPSLAASSSQTRGSVGRNDPCPCGSGRKFKKCCGAASGH